MRRFGLIAIVLAAACGQTTHDATPDGAPASGSDAALAADAALPPTTASIIVHYPMGSHTLTLRGSGGGLSWTAGATMASTGTDTMAYTITGLTEAIEWKPLLDDSTWARGPNYHVAPGSTLEIWPHFTTTAGTVETLIASFHSTHVADDRPIYAYLPASYAENPSARFPVVYMHDGQNLWAALPDLAFAATWNVDTTFDAATEQGACTTSTALGWGGQPLGEAPTTCTGDGDCPSGECRTFPEAIVIGIGNTANRINELTPTTDPTTAGGGGADGYLAMIVDDLKPAIDAQLRTKTDVASTAMAGSSLGGLVTAYAGIHYPNVFGTIAAISPSTWWNNDVIVGDVAAMPATARPSIVYVDSGAGSADDEVDTDMLAAEYVTLGYVAGTNFRHVIQPNAQHAETYWAERFPGAMQLLLGVR